MARNKTYSRFFSDLLGLKSKRIDTRLSHGKSGKMHNKFKHAHFIAWDGEGVTNENHPTELTYDEQGNIKTRVEHQLYALLMNNEGTIKINPSGLSTLECLDTIMTSTNDKRAIHVCFGASYDTNMMLRDLPETLLRALHQGLAVDYKQYRLTFRPHKSFEIREYSSIQSKFKYSERQEKWIRDYKKTIVLWDVFGFFQTSFVETLDKYFVRGNQLPQEKEKYRDIIARIKEGKIRRGTFTEEELQTFVVPYTKLEVDALEQLMQRLRMYLEQADMTITRWDGAGACAASLLKKYGVKEHIDEKWIPREVVTAAETAFAGGRIETTQYGNYECPVYHYDLNSAYPSAMETLPSLKEAIWEHKKGPLTHDEIRTSPTISLFLVSWKCKHPEQTNIAPFPWRDSVGNVFFPPMGKTWVWRPELETCIDTMSVGKYAVEIYVHECYVMHPTNDIQPYAFIRELYEKRKVLVKEKNGAEKVIKLGLNSLYGKTAQSIGYNVKDGKKPPYHNLVIAGMTTSITRAKMVRACMQAPDDIIMLATDGVYSAASLNLQGMDSDDKKLGEWEYSKHDYMTIVASGVYWYKTEGEDENSYSRGFDKYTLIRDLILEKWKNHGTELPCETTRFVGLGSAIGLNNFSYWCTWRTVYRVLGLNMEKVAKRQERRKKNNPYVGLVRTYARIPKQIRLAKELDQFPYTKSFMMSHKYAFQWDSANEIDGISMRAYLDECANTLA